MSILDRLLGRDSDPNDADEGCCGMEIEELDEVDD